MRGDQALILAILLALRAHDLGAAAKLPPSPRAPRGPRVFSPPRRERAPSGILDRSSRGGRVARVPVSGQPGNGCLLFTVEGTRQFLTLNVV